MARSCGARSWSEAHACCEAPERPRGIDEWPEDVLHALAAALVHGSSPHRGELNGPAWLANLSACSRNLARVLRGPDVSEWLGREHRLPGLAFLTGIADSGNSTRSIVHFLRLWHVRPS